MSNELEVPSGPEESERVGRCGWEEGEEKNGAVGKDSLCIHRFSNFLALY